MKATEQARRVPIARLLCAAAAVGAVSLLPAVAAGASGSGGVTVSSQSIGSMGKVLVANGRALYTLTPSATACGTGCLKIWPALTAKSATAGSGVAKSKLGVTTASNGTHQITYKGKPLYYFSVDKKGTVKGNVTDQWGKWTAVVVAKAAGSHAGSNSGGGANAGGGGVNF
jgi:predicted lipoprotein with Yx(FWY)xxD motif